MKKYILTENTKIVDGAKLFQIKRCSNNKLGGWIQTENNLSQDGNAWVYGDARISGDAQVYGNARVYGDAWVYGDARVSGNAQVYGYALVSGDAKVSASHHIFHVITSPYNITITPQNIQIGCLCYNIKTWKKQAKIIAKKEKISNNTFKLIKEICLTGLKSVLS